MICRGSVPWGIACGGKSNAGKDDEDLTKNVFWISMKSDCLIHQDIMESSYIHVFSDNDIVTNMTICSTTLARTVRDSVESMTEPELSESREDYLWPSDQA